MPNQDHSAGMISVFQFREDSSHSINHFGRVIIARGVAAHISSDDMRGYTTGDNYTPEVVNAVAAVLSELKDRYHPRRVILVGHSGGAAIVGDLMSLQGAAVDGALMVSCPCDL